MEIAPSENPMGLVEGPLPDGATPVVGEFYGGVAWRLLPGIYIHLISLPPKLGPLFQKAIRHADSETKCEKSRHL